MWKYYEICCVSITIYIKKSTNGRPEKKKNVTTVATVPHGTVANIRNLKKIKQKEKKEKKSKVPYKISTVDEQWKMMYKQCKSIVEKEHKSMTRKKKKNNEQYILKKPKVL